MNKIAEQYRAKADSRQALVPDFHSVRQALNVASADQRVLVLLTGSEQDLATLRTSLRTVASDPQVLGRFHFDFEAQPAEWTQSITGADGESGILLIRPSEFGTKGEVLAQLSLGADNPRIVAALVAANATFAKTTKKKTYLDHVQKGKQLGIYFESPVPYGEDRNADGVIDAKGSRR